MKLCTFILFLIFKTEILISTFGLTNEFCSFDGSNHYLTYICSVGNRQNLFQCTYSNMQPKSIYNISFQNCNISELNGDNFYGMRGNSELTEINISGVGLTTLSDDTFKHFPKLKKLIASKNQLKNIRLSNGQMEHLDLSFNQFTEVEFTVQCYELKILILSNNKITRFANNAFSNLRKLKKLDLSFNDLNQLSEKFDTSSSELAEVLVHHNKLNNLPEDIFSKTNLLHLDLSYNQFTDIESLKRTGAHELKTLNLTNNQIANISDTAFVYFTKLEVLDLSFNNLTNLVDGTFDEQRHLKNLSIANNNLLQIDFGILSPLMDLESLDFSNNHIKIINTIGEHLGVFSFLKRINISNNKIIEINGITNSTFPALNYLNLRDNQFGCAHLKRILKSFDLQKLRLDIDPSSKIKEGISYRGVACQNDSSLLSDDSDSILLPEQIGITTLRDQHSMKHLHKKMNTLTTCLIMIIVLIVGILLYSNRDRLLSVFQRGQNIQHNSLNGYAEDREPVMSNSIIDTL